MPEIQADHAVRCCIDTTAAVLLSLTCLMMLQSTSLTAATALLETSPDAEGMETARQLLHQSRSAMQDAARLPQGRELVLQDKMLAYLPLQVLHSGTPLRRFVSRAVCCIRPAWCLDCMGGLRHLNNSGVAAHLSVAAATALAVSKSLPVMLAFPSS